MQLLKYGRSIYTEMKPELQNKTVKSFFFFFYKATKVQCIHMCLSGKQKYFVGSTTNKFNSDYFWETISFHYIDNMFIIFSLIDIYIVLILHK